MYIHSVEAGPYGESGQAAGEDKPQKYYDDVYFDSDEEEMFTGGKLTCAIPALSVTAKGVCNKIESTHYILHVIVCVYTCVCMCVCVFSVCY